MTKFRLLKATCIAGACFLAACAHAGIAMSSNLYLTAGDQHNIHVIRDSVLVNSWTSHNENGESAIAVGSTVRTLGAYHFSGAEYTLGGTYTGTDYGFPVGVFSAMDGTTDGTNNYLVDYGTGNVIRTDLDWQNRTVIFNAGHSVMLGITYDFTDNTLWVSGYEHSTIDHYTLDGTLIVGDSFTTHFNRLSCLALDHGTGTLWVGSESLGTFFGFSKDGDLIGSAEIPALNDQNTLGGEFASVPEPGTILVISAGIVFAALRRRG